MPEPIPPLSDERLAKIRAELERTTDPDWRPHATVGQLLAEVDRLRAALADGHYDSACIAVEERDELRSKVRAIEAIRVWRNEDGRGFLFADDVRQALGLIAAPHNIPGADCA